MAQAPAQNIQTDAYFSNLPTGFVKSSTPEGGTAYKDASGNLYLPQSGGGLTLAPASLPQNNMQVVAGQGNAPVSTAQPIANAPVITSAPVSTPAPKTTAPATTAPAAPSGTSTPASQYDMTPSEASGGDAGITAYNNRIAALIQSQGDSMASAPIAPTGSSTRTSASIEQDFQDTISKLTEPTAPDTNTEQTTLEGTPGGVNDIQSQLTTAQNDLTTAQNALQAQQATDASKPGVVATLINGQMKMLSAEDSQALKTQQDLVSSLTTQLKNANTAVATIMKNNQTDYENAQKQYNTDYSNAYKMYTSEESQLSKDQTSALATQKAVIASFKGSNAGVNSITPADEAQYEQIDMAAGLPVGTTLAAIQSEMDITKFVKGGNGEMYVEGTAPDGTPFVASIGNVGTNTPASQTNITTGKWTKPQLEAYTNQFSSQMDSLKGTDGFVSNDDYNSAEKNWVALGGTAQSFATAFKQYKTNRGNQ